VEALDWAERELLVGNTVQGHRPCQNMQIEDYVSASPHSTRRRARELRPTRTSAGSVPPRLTGGERESPL